MPLIDQDEALSETWSRQPKAHSDYYLTQVLIPTINNIMFIFTYIHYNSLAGKYQKLQEKYQYLDMHIQ